MIMLYDTCPYSTSVNAVFIDNERTVSHEKGFEIWSLTQDSNIHWVAQASVLQPQWLKLYDLLICGTLRRKA